jgi:type II secretory pathway pseudopilin PulG
MYVKKLKALNSFGDTIVEVMVVLAVLGLAISISYATANRSLLDTRQAQENSEATELVQAQLEALRTLTSAKVAPNPFQVAPFSFCISTTAPYTVLPYPLNSCKQSYYTVLTTYTSLGIPGVTGGTFQVQATWADVEGQGNDTVTLLYRLYQTP